MQDADVSYHSSADFEFADSSPQVVSQLRAAGAIIIAKTNIPQTLLGFECNNPLWGRTTNPYSKGHTSGGSSGGEGAVLASDGSVIGIGSDIGKQSPVRFTSLSHRSMFI